MDEITHKVWLDGTKEWRFDGKFHRVDGPAIIHPDGREEWYLDGKRHREGGPAVVDPSGHEHWCIHGKYHRIDGPASSWPVGNVGWWLNGLPYTSFNDWLFCTPIPKKKKIELKLIYG